MLRLLGNTSPQFHLWVSVSAQPKQISLVGCPGEQSEISRLLETILLMDHCGSSSDSKEHQS